MALIDVCKYGGSDEDIVWRFPSDELSTRTQVIVMESQEAVFYREGEARDILGPGRHTLSTGNIPILEKFINLPFGGQSPFTAEVYYVNKTTRPNLKWGTPQPIQIREPEFQVILPVRANGIFGVRVKDSKVFINGIVGKTASYQYEDVKTYLKGLITTRIKDIISESLTQQKIPFAEINSYLNEISVVGKNKLGDDFTKYGLELTDFLIGTISVPEDDPNYRKITDALSERASMNILGVDYKTKQTLDAMKTAAANEGAGGSAVGAGLGMGMGAGMGAMMPGMMQQNVAQNQGGSQGAASISCPSCGKENSPSSKFCAHCGKEMTLQMMSCYSCGKSIPQGSKFCPECGTTLAKKACPQCSTENEPTAKFCGNCGTQL